MKKKILALLLAGLLLSLATPALAAEDDDAADSSYSQTEGDCQGGACRWKRGG